MGIGVGGDGNNEVSGSSRAEDGDKKLERTSIDKINSMRDPPSQLSKKTPQISSSLLNLLPSFMSSASTPANDDDHNHYKGIIRNNRAHNYVVMDTQAKHNRRSIVPVLSSPVKKDLDD